MLDQASGRKPRVLVVDGNPEEIRGLTIFIQQNQWQSTLATSGKRGIQLALASPFDVILLEACLPDMDGFAVCRILKESPEASAAPIIFLTRAGSIKDRLQGLTCGGVDYLIKPCVPEEVFARMRIHQQLVSHQRPGGEQPEKLSYDQVILRAAINYIRDHLADHSSLEDIARHVGVYEKKLSLIFRRYTGVTVFSWIREERLRRSMELLAETPMPIQDIAEEIGFGSACNFTTAFRLRTGRTPNQFRKESSKGLTFSTVSTNHGFKPSGSLPSIN